jgi:hypothetical protein
MINKILPLLNRFVPSALAFKGIQKIDPRIGKFLDIAGGIYGADAALDFVRNKFQPEQIETGGRQLRPDEEASQQQIANSRQLPNLIGNIAKTGAALAGGAGLAKLGAQALQPQEQLAGPSEQQDIISQYSPELRRFLDSQIQAGRDPIQAGAVAQNDSRFKTAINKIQKAAGANWSEILNSLYGGGQQQAPQQPQQAQKGVDPQLMQIMQSIRSSIQNLRAS